MSDMSMASLIALAADQGGVIRIGQLADHGVSASSAQRRVRDGSWQRVQNGVYRVLPARTDLDLLRSAITALDGAVVSHRSAALLLGLTGNAPAQPEVTVRPSTTHSYPEVVVRRTRLMPASHVGELDGLPTTTVARTLVDLAGDLPSGRWIPVADAAIQSRRTTLSAMASVAELICGQGRPGSTTVKTYLTDELAGASALERRAIAVIAWAGLPTPAREYSVPWQPSQRFDLAYPTARLAIELDGRAHHIGPGQFERDRRRDRQAARHGWLVLRFTWSDVVNRRVEFVAEIAQFLAARSTG